jgi:cation:H+ antiporter
MTLAIIQLPVVASPIWLLLLLLVVGFAALAYGGDLLTSGAASVSVNNNINPVVVGLTVISVATSMPEMATSLIAVRTSPDLALGNILGSNIANIGLIMGIAAIIAPLSIQQRLIRREVPFLILVTILFTVFAFGGYSQIEGIFLLSLTVAYLIFVVRSANLEKRKNAILSKIGSRKISKVSTPKAILLVVLGGGLLALGADFLVQSSVVIASRMGASDLFVGLTIVAIGTSLPELAASVAAVRSGHADLCAGNIIGSNLFNLMLIGGSVATISTIKVDERLFFVEFPCLLFLSILLLCLFKNTCLVTRREGLMLLLLYVLVVTLSGLAQFNFLF